MAEPQKIEMIPIEKITTGWNMRQAERDIPALACSIDQLGLLQPIVVSRDGDGGYHLVAGRRRLAAFKFLERTAIPCLVTSGMSAQEIADRQAAENLQRDDMNNLEAALLVAHHCELVAKELDIDIAETMAEAILVPGNIITNVAGRLGKPNGWVRDRLYVNRLTGPTREWLAEGSLSLQHARSIAKLADPALREEAARAARQFDSKGEHRHAWTTDEIERFVKNNLRSLKVVPWKADVAFRGLPACTDCPHNSANAAELFGSGDEVEGKCLKPSCFARKEKLATAAIEKGIKPAAAACKGKDAITASPKALAEADLVPTIVRETTFARRVAATLGTSKRGGEAGPTPARPKAEKTPPDPRAEARDEINKRTEALALHMFKAMVAAKIDTKRILAAIELIQLGASFDSSGLDPIGPVPWHAEGDKKYEKLRGRPTEAQRAVIGSIVDAMVNDSDDPASVFGAVMMMLPKQTAAVIEKRTLRAMTGVNEWLLVLLHRAMVDSTGALGPYADHFNKQRGTDQALVDAPPSFRQMVAEIFEAQKKAAAKAEPEPKKPAKTDAKHRAAKPKKKKSKKAAR